MSSIRKTPGLAGHRGEEKLNVDEAEHRSEASSITAPLRALIATTSAGGAYYWCAVLEGESAPTPIICRFPERSLEAAIRGAMKVMVSHIRDGRIIRVTCARDSALHRLIELFDNPRVKPAFRPCPRFALGFLHAESLAQAAARRSAA